MRGPGLRSTPAGRPGRGAPVRGPGPLTLDPILVAKPWGGNKLSALGKLPASGQPGGAVYGESWEVADLGGEALGGSEDGDSFGEGRRTPVGAGPHRGKTLRRLIAELGPALLGSARAAPDGAFPLLFKLLDAAQPLSIQVHPDETQAAGRRGWQPKTESWYVLDAEPGAAIYKGLRPGVGMEEVRAAAGTPAIVPLVERIEVRRGDFHHLPAGTMHALGAGVTVAEVQTPSDTTFRLYDWTEEYGRPPRPLQILEALQALSAEPPACPFLAAMEGEGNRLLIDTPHYRMREHRTHGEGVIDIGKEPELRILMTAEGRAVVEAEEAPPIDLRTGAALVIPAADAPYTAVTAPGAAALLEIMIGAAL